MSPNVRIDDEVFRALQAHAEPLVDTPNSVLRRVLGLQPNGSRHAEAPGASDVARDGGGGFGGDRALRRDPLAWILGRDGSSAGAPASAPARTDS